jgi:hypothetical protein
MKLDSGPLWLESAVAKPVIIGKRLIHGCSPAIPSRLSATFRAPLQLDLNQLRTPAIVQGLELMPYVE